MKQDVSSAQRTGESKKAVKRTREGDAASSDIDDWKNKYLRVLADYQNLEKRTASLILLKEQTANAAFARRILSVSDLLELAQRHLKDPGLDIALREWSNALSEHGVKRISVTDREFDPSIMECIEAVNGPENRVIEEVSPGYYLHDELLRPAKVKVGIGKK